MTKIYTPNASPNPNSWAERTAFLEKEEWPEDAFVAAASTNPPRTVGGRSCRRRTLFIALLLVIVFVGLAATGSTDRLTQANQYISQFRPQKQSPFYTRLESSPAIEETLPLRPTRTLNGELHEELTRVQPTSTKVPSKEQDKLSTSIDDDFVEVTEDLIDAETEDEDQDDAFAIVEADILDKLGATTTTKEPASVTSTARPQTTRTSTLLPTRPKVPSIARPPLDEERFISFLPHSGYHNQRIALTNALLLGQILNRTVLIPPVRVGNPIGWREKSHLQFYWEQEQKTQAQVDECTPHLLDLERGIASAEVFAQCSEYNSFAQLSWSLLVDLDKAGMTVPMLDREDLSFKWFTSAAGLNLRKEEIYRLPDITKYEDQYYLSPTQPKLAKDAKGGNYNKIHRLDDFMTPEMDKYRLLEFGSLYGTYRIVLDGADVDPIWQQRLLRIQNAMVFDFPLLDNIADAIRARMGDTSNFFGLHLRVGDGAFERMAVAHMKSAFTKTIQSVFRFNERQTLAIVKEAEQAGERRKSKRSFVDNYSNITWDWTEGRHPARDHPHLEEADALFARHSQTKRQIDLTQNSETLKCRGMLHTAPDRLVLNAHIYIATDSRRPREDPALELFFNTFPCAHVLNDFEDVVPELKAMQDLRSAEEAVKLNRFLVPFLEAIVASSAVRMVGTSGSTFSWFVGTTLHKSFWPKQAVQTQIQVELLESLRSSG